MCDDMRGLFPALKITAEYQAITELSLWRNISRDIIKGRHDTIIADNDSILFCY